jgi:hypothetical protein
VASRDLGTGGTMLPVDLDHHRDLCRQRMIAALLGIIHGVGITDAEGHPALAPVLNSARRTTVFGALGDAAQRLDEPLSARELAMVDRACAALGIARTSDRMDANARAILDALIAKRSA